MDGGHGRRLPRGLWSFAPVVVVGALEVSGHLGRRAWIVAVIVSGLLGAVGHVRFLRSPEGRVARQALGLDGDATSVPTSPPGWHGGVRENHEFVPAPNWPVPPPGFVPDLDWMPDPSWPGPPPGWVFWRPCPPTRVRQARAIVAVVATFLDVVLVVVSYVPGSPRVPFGFAGVLFILIFPVFGSVVIERSSAQQAARLPGRSQVPRKPWQAPTPPLMTAPPRVLVAGGFLLAALFVSGLTGIALIKGQPGGSPGHYYADDHGSRIPLSTAGHDYQSALQNRIFSSIPALFLTISTLAVWSDLPGARRR